MKKLKYIGLSLCGAFIAGAISTFFFSPVALKGNGMNRALASVQAEIPQSQSQARKKVKLALLLDTSGSMNGLLEQAKSQLWNIVNELTRATSQGQAPDLEIAVYQYGNSGLSAVDGYIRQEVGFTSDLDIVSEKLFALTTSGGDEYCGQAIFESLDEMEWGHGENDYKAVFIAGNESFHQGNVAADAAFQLARAKGVSVNAIYCGAEGGGISEGWDATSRAAIGGFLNINSNQKVVHLATPFDSQISDLNTRLNETYVWYGDDGLTNFNNMNVQDFNANQYGEANMVNRAMTKNSSFYQNRNASWDLVDKIREDKNFSISSIKSEKLPKEMRGMTDAEKVKYVVDKKRQRDEINRQIAELGKQRAAYLANARKATHEDASLGQAIVNTMKQQARLKGFAFAEDGIAVQEKESVPSLVDFDYFLDLASEVKEYRKDRLVNFNDFLRMSEATNTIILDTRSKANYDAMHLRGAIHLNYSNFNVYDLARLIPDKNTRILIYCNNNIDTDGLNGLVRIRPEVVEAIQMNMVSKAAVPSHISNRLILNQKRPYSGVELDEGRTLALNIPTFINLYGYGYRNVYELSELIQPNDPRLVLEGNSIPKDWSLR